VGNYSDFLKLVKGFGRYFEMQEKSLYFSRFFAGEFCAICEKVFLLFLRFKKLWITTSDKLEPLAELLSLNIA